MYVVCWVQLKKAYVWHHVMCTIESNVCSDYVNYYYATKWLFTSVVPAQWLCHSDTTFLIKLTWDKNSAFNSGCLKTNLFLISYTVTDNWYRQMKRDWTLLGALVVTPSAFSNWMVIVTIPGSASSCCWSAWSSSSALLITPAYRVATVLAYVRFQLLHPSSETPCLLIFSHRPRSLISVTN